jgi:catechol 2,3-dioxygenase-like lactoylglutathione lyase family enzyme
MTVYFNHTIVAASDKQASARFLADILGLPEPSQVGPFAAVRVGLNITLQFAELDALHYADRDQVHPQHYAFAVEEADFDAILARIRARGLTYWADSAGQHPNEIDHRPSGRGLYWRDPDGHWLEILTYATYATDVSD